MGDATTIGYDNVGLKGTIPVVFQTMSSSSSGTNKKDEKETKNNKNSSIQSTTVTTTIADTTTKIDTKTETNTKTSMAWVGHPIRYVASQAGQYISYGCGKGHMEKSKGELNLP